ncbi:uncharacterized protein LOC114515681 [Dendronephthya gigantea]|uniref:uncharacterized protein LOC114515681 n=1 Tax=Dendronephthya gigantea TaxID=151771 RepID=UPI00106BD4BC|nr:uncharacterized protein LOC114515681 [Dendronephthya gigantea]
MIQTVVKSLYEYLPWRVWNFADWIRQIALAVREYLSSEEENARDGVGLVGEVDDDNARDNPRSSGPMNSEHENAAGGNEIVADSSRPVVNINISSNTGTVVIGDQPTVKCVGSKKAESREKAKIGASPSLVSSKRDTVTNNKENNANSPEKEAPTRSCKKGNEKPKFPRRRKCAGERGNLPSKIPSHVAQIHEIDKDLSTFRENGEWKAHEEAIEKFKKRFFRDEDNHDVILLLRYEQAAALYEKRDLNSCMKLTAEIAKEVNLNETNWDQINDTQKMIYCKCLFLASRRHCIVGKKLGMAEKALSKASKLLCKYKNIELESFLYLEYAYYHFCLNQCTESKVNLVISYTSRAEDTSSALIGKVFKEKRDRIRREILLLRCQAIIQFILASVNSVLPQDLSNMLNASMAELEGQLWNRISPKQKVAFYKLKSSHFEILVNPAQTLEHARKALEIAEKCKFNNEVLLLMDRIRRLQKYPEEPVNDSEQLVKKVLEIVSTTDGNLESNGGELTERGIFSTDESDFDIVDACILGQSRYPCLLQPIEGRENDKLDEV